MPLTRPAMPALNGTQDGWMPPVEQCPVSIATRLVGDRWSLVIVREIMAGASRFNAIHRGTPSLSRSLLSARLKYLERIGVVERRVGDRQSQRFEYRLTPSGAALRPVLEALGAWALAWQLPARGGDGELSVSALLWQMYQGLNRSALPRPEMTIQFKFPSSAPSSGWIHVSDDRAGVCIGASEHPVDLTVVVEVGVLNELWWGRRQCAAAITAGDVGFEGPPELAHAYPGWFTLPEVEPVQLSY